ncbi:MAG TPA: hypothetical protein VL651_09270 [Bacteroidia bacterium]|jgi:hypothetical protein|nr:hypothetical protein [Bacteroidia bacterium]
MNEKENDKGEKIPEPVFHESENFMSAYFGKVPDAVLNQSATKPDMKLISSLVAQLTDPNQKETRIQVLSMLRDAQAQDLIVSIIAMKEYIKHRAALIASAWESGLDFSKHLDFFIDLALDPDFIICLESCTVITENMDGPFDATLLKEANGKLEKASATHRELIDPVVEKFNLLTR